MTSRSVPTTLALLWLVGNALRLPILAVPPVIPALRGEFNLSGTEIGLLTSLPVVLFAAAAVLGSRLVGRVGAVTAAVAGLLLAAFGSAVRGAAVEVVSLFAATIVMGAGVSVTQPALPVLVARWLPKHVGLGTGIYTNGLLVGEILPVALFPLIFPLFDDSWRAIFVLWAVPIVAIAVLVLAIAPPESAAPTGMSRRWWPAWSARDIWLVGLIFASGSAIYFASNAFLPGYLSEAGRSDLISPALTALNLGQLPASLLLIGFAPRLEGKAWPFVTAGLLALGGVAGVVATAGPITVVSAAVLGFAGGAAFALGLTLPPLLSAPEEVASVSGAMFTISYGSTVVVSILSGLVWDFTGAARFAFLPIALSALPAILLPRTVELSGKRGRRAVR